MFIVELDCHLAKNKEFQMQNPELHLKRIKALGFTMEINSVCVPLRFVRIKDC